MSETRNSALSDNGVTASRLQLPPGDWTTVLDCLCARFPAISRERWLDRMAREQVLDDRGRPIGATTPYRLGAEIRYYREVPHEQAIAGEEALLFVDAHLVVADKPHGLPVLPAGEYVAETLLARLIRRLGNPHLVPLHRLDRETAGLVLFSANPETRRHYHALFSERGIEKSYEAIAAPLPELAFPHRHRSRLVRGEPFFRMAEAAGAANSETLITVRERGGRAWRYDLTPITGRKHQLRVHMAALGAAIANDRCYPDWRPPRPEDASLPLQLLAKTLAFTDPLTGQRRRFESGFRLNGSLD